MESDAVKIDIKNAKYLKLTADDNSANWWAAWYDEAVYANAKLIKEDYKEDTSDIAVIKTVDTYDKELKQQAMEQSTVIFTAR